MDYSFGDVICKYRQGRKMTQEEFASRIGVTPQAVSKWERGNGLPDISLLKGICAVLEISADALLGIESKVVENGNPIEDAEIKSNLIAEPMEIDFSPTLIPMICEGLGTPLVQQSRKRLAKEYGLLLPIIRFRDNETLGDNEYRILSYGKVVQSGTSKPDDKSLFMKLMDGVEGYCINHYDEVINKNIVKTMIDNLKNRYPGVVDGVVPERISYLTVEQKLKEILRDGKPIRDLIRIIEAIESDFGM